MNNCFQNRIVNKRQPIIGLIIEISETNLRF